MKFKKYYFENFSCDIPFDADNPRYVLAMDGVDAVLERVAVSNPYSLRAEEFDDPELVKALLRVEVLQEKDGRLGMAVPFFLDKDAEELKTLSKKAAGRIAAELLFHREKIATIAERIDNGYPVERNLYHMLCAYIFDGLMFDYLAENGLVTTSCVHDSGLDYLVVLYEDTASLNEYGDLLLCSYNRLTVKGKGFVSFGDSNGNRKDFYRYMRQKERDLLSEEEKEYVLCPTEELIENFVRMADGEEVEPAYVETYERFGYCRDGKIDVPVYGALFCEVANELYRFAAGIAESQIRSALAAMRYETGLSAIAHGVEVKDIANEIYHLIFGEVNEMLVKSGMVTNPPYYPGEGRYFKSFER